MAIQQGNSFYSNCPFNIYNVSHANVEIVLQIFYLFIFEVMVGAIFMLYAHLPEGAVRSFSLFSFVLLELVAVKHYIWYKTIIFY